MGCIALLILPKIPAEEKPVEHSTMYLFPWQLRTLIGEENHDIDSLDFNFIVDSNNDFTMHNVVAMFNLDAPQFMLPSTMWENTLSATIGLFLFPIAFAAFVEDYREFLRETRTLREDNPLLWHQLMRDSIERERRERDRASPAAWEREQREELERVRADLNPRSAPNLPRRR